MNPVRTFTAIALAATLAACSTVMTTPPSGFLSDEQALQPGADAGTASRRAVLAIDPARVEFAAVQWRPPASAQVSAEERAALVERLDAALRERVAALPAAPGGRPVRLRAAITRLEPVSPALNTVGSLLLIGPLDRGGAAVEIEAVDAETGRQVAALKLGYFAPITDLKARFSKLAPAEIALGKAAADFGALLLPATAVAASSGS